jgi:hypothetical protein
VIFPGQNKKTLSHLFVVIDAFDFVVGHPGCLREFGHVFGHLFGHLFVGMV